MNINECHSRRPLSVLTANFSSLHFTGRTRLLHCAAVKYTCITDRICIANTMAMQPHNMDPRLPLKIQENVTDLGSLARQVLRSSKSNEMLLHAAKNFASQEGTVESSLQTLKKMDILASHLRFQAEAIERNVEVMDTLQDQLSTLQR